MSIVPPENTPPPELRAGWPGRLPRLLALLFYVDELRSHLPVWARYATAAVAALAVYGLRVAVLHEGETSYPFLFAFPAIVFSAALLGIGPALLAAVMGGVLPLMLLPDVELTPRQEFTRLVGLVAYSVTSLLLTALVRGFALARVTAEGSVREADTLNRRLGTLLVEKEGLLGTTGRLNLELRHRTKNELAQIVALLHFQARVAATPEEKTALAAAMARIRGVGNVHDMLSRQMERPDHPVRSDEFLQGVVAWVRDSYPASTVVWDVSVERHHLPHTTATPLGLLLTELATNVQKHAFHEGSPGRAQVIFRRVEGSYELLVEDDGIGVANAAPSRPGIGERVLTGVTRNLSGELETSASELGSGTRRRLRFPVPPEAGVASWAPSDA